MIRDSWIPGLLLGAAEKDLGGKKLPPEPFCTSTLDGDTDMRILHMSWFYPSTKGESLEDHIWVFRVSWMSGLRKFSYHCKYNQWVHLRGLPTYLSQVDRTKQEFAELLRRTQENSKHWRLEWADLWEGHHMIHPFDASNYVTTMDMYEFVEPIYWQALQDTVSPDEVPFQPFKQLLS